ncbi:PREDICTED: delta-sarcoglycan-like [Papilio xuthus]|uniref:Delta-sarcoglycan-like n=1 Tax=Papilio xuthus TaxID=66420 RepID=A0AAJ6ZLJ4_PAPXU|nr:PREDICTED: delta-sarcoglycan-like [Papilio xuthus]XP_013175000.1 PREDICTED: delta-sarcoglycan-like [Papilio xuthus]XP_013175001.1 PREDICTED: delta-sarcoglycan-like [Papilio xuthus]XP_013175002.1 PREDICTED: delta-sarcoglycan-like [Papilio xuthus]
MSEEDAQASTGGIHGWGFTPTGDPPPASVGTNDPPKSKCLPEAITRGWKRTTLYGILLVLMIIIFLNIALTLWIVSALRLSMKGIGPIKIIKDGIQLEGQAWIVDKLVASTITSPIAQPITLHSFRNFTVLVSDPNHVELAKMFIKRDSIEYSGRKFEVFDSKGGKVFHASRDEVRVFAEAFAVDSEAGLTVNSAIQAPLIRAPPSSKLQLESLTRRLDLRAPQSIYLESRAGGIDITSHSDIRLDSIVGAIRIDAPNIVIDNLKIANTTTNSQKYNRANKVYQLCACASGKLFLAAPDAVCGIPENDTELCR